MNPDKVRRIQQIVQRARSTSEAHKNRVEELSVLVTELSNRIYELEGDPDKDNTDDDEPTSSDQEPGLNIPRLHNLKRRTPEVAPPEIHHYVFTEVNVSVVDDHPLEETVTFSLATPAKTVRTVLPWKKARELMEGLDNRTTELAHPNDKPEEPSRGSWARQGFQDSMGSRRLVFPGDCPGTDSGEHEWSGRVEGGQRGSCRHCPALAPALDKK